MACVIASRSKSCFLEIFFTSDRYLHYVHAEDSWMFLMALKDFEATLAACISSPTQDADLRIAELKILYFQHFMMVRLFLMD